MAPMTGPLGGTQSMYFMTIIAIHKMGKNARDNPYITSFLLLVPTPIVVKTMFQVSRIKLISR